MGEEIYPGSDWQKRPSSILGFSQKQLNETYNWIKKTALWRKYRILIIREGYIAEEWQRGINASKRLSLASAAKPIYSSILGIAIKEGAISSIDAKVIDYYPEFINIKEGEGPKPGRFAKPEDRDITFRQLITNMSGYMKPGESPDSKFHYQTYGMNILSHAIAKTYGLYDSEKPRKYLGFRKLIDEKIKTHIKAKWHYSYFNFPHPREAKTNIFGNYTVVESNARDMARIGYLWLKQGNWEKKQIIPKQWIKEATQTAPNIKANCPESQWNYGYAFWVNDHHKLWPNLPRDAYSASGSGQQNIWVCPSLDLVIVQSPGVYSHQTDDINTRLLEMIVESLKK